MSRVAKLYRCPTTDKWILKMWDIYKMKCSASAWNDETTQISATWMELEDFILSEVN